MSNAMSSNLALDILSSKGAVGVEGLPGSGKSFFMQELALQALSIGRRVRIMDVGHSYLQLARSLGCRIFSSPEEPDFLGAWQSNAPLVLLDLDDAPGKSFSFDHLDLSRETVFICDEFYRFRTVYRPLNCTSVLCAQMRDDIGTLVDDYLVFNENYSLGWTRAGEAPIKIQLFVGPLRKKTFTRRQSLMA